MLARLRRFDKGIADGEAALTAVTLLIMIVLALLQAALGRLRDAQVEWAIELLSSFGWVDPFLKVATVWIAFLGASLATYHDKHIAIDVVSRFLPPKPRALVGGGVKIISGLISVLLAVVFWSAVYSFNTPETIDFEYSVMDLGGDIHVCEAGAEQLDAIDKDRPTIYCGIRALLQAAGAPTQTPIGAAMLIMPVVFLIMGVRLGSKGIATLIDVGSGRVNPEEQAERVSLPGFSSGDVPIGSDADAETNGDSNDPKGGAS